MGSGLDNFEARYFGSNLGRFMSLDDTDPEDHLGNPQGLNLYSYVQNNPANATDPDGHDCAYVSEGVAYVIRGDCSKVPGSALAITYVPGKIDEDSGSYDPRNGTLSFNSVAAAASAQALGANNTVNLGVAGTSSGILKYTGVAGTLDKNITALGNGSDTGSAIQHCVIAVANRANGKSGWPRRNARTE